MYHIIIIMQKTITPGSHASIPTPIYLHVALFSSLPEIPLPFSKPSHLAPVQSYPHPAPSLPWGPNLGVGTKGGREEGKCGHFRAEEPLRGEGVGAAGEQTQSWEAPYWERPLSDSVRQRPGLGTQPSPKSRPQALILAPEPAPVKRPDAPSF